MICLSGLLVCLTVILEGSCSRLRVAWRFAAGTIDCFWTLKWLSLEPQVDSDRWVSRSRILSNCDGFFT